MENIRVLIAKCGLDGHDRGAKVIARFLRDEGFEVIYSGLHNSADEIARIAVQEDVKGIGLSVMSGAHLTIFSDLIGELKLHNAEDIVLFGGGIVPDTDREFLKMNGVAAIFGPGSSLAEIGEWVRSNLS